MSCFVRLGERVASDQFLQQRHVGFFRDLANKLGIKELDPEPDKVFFFNVARLKNAVELEESAPVDLCILVLDIHSNGCEQTLADMRQSASEEGAILNEVCHVDALGLVLNSPGLARLITLRT